MKKNGEMNSFLVKNELKNDFKHAKNNQYDNASSNHTVTFCQHTGVLKSVKTHSTPCWPVTRQFGRFRPRPHSAKNILDILDDFLDGFLDG